MGVSKKDAKKLKELDKYLSSKIEELDNYLKSKRLAYEKVQKE